MTPLQHSCLAFGSRDMKIKSATIQSFALGSNTSGKAEFGGVGRAKGPWSVFGGMASLQQESANIFRTDVQIKLEDATGYKAFLDYSLPFAVTLAIDPEETLRIYFVKGGLPSPEPGDFCLDQWTAFAAENLDTYQLIPISGYLPTLMEKSPKFLIGGLICGLIGATLLLSQADTVLGVAFLVTGLVPIGIYIAEKRSYLKAVSEASRLASDAVV
jgi:hypothetical protein